MKWYTGLVRFTHGGLDGDPPDIELIRVEATGPAHARSEIEKEHKRQIDCKLRDETWTDPDEPDPEYAEMEDDVFIPDGMNSIDEYDNYAPEIKFVFQGKLKSVGYER